MLTTITCPGCGECIAVSEDEFGFVSECGGVGEGTCDAGLTKTADAHFAAVAAYKASVQPDPYCLASDAVERSGGAFPGIVAVPYGAFLMVPVAPYLSLSGCSCGWVTVRAISNPAVLMTS